MLKQGQLHKVNKGAQTKCHHLVIILSHQKVKKRCRSIKTIRWLLIKKINSTHQKCKILYFKKAKQIIQMYLKC